MSETPANYSSGAWGSYAIFIVCAAISALFFGVLVEQHNDKFWVMIIAMFFGLTAALLRKAKMRYTNGLPIFQTAG